MPIEILESIAHVNYNVPRPRPVDPAVLFDLVKIRRLVDEATNLAVRAAGDISSPVLTSVNGGMAGNIYGNAANPVSRLSRERKFRMREQASRKLGCAYRLDDMACSVATMQSASPLDNIASLVLQHSSQDLDAKYVHFFHEKIPSRQLQAFSGLKSLTDIISERPNEGEVLRTRAMIKTFTSDQEGAIHDLLLAMSLSRAHQQPRDVDDQDTGVEWQAGKRRRDVILAEKDQPSSLEGQLLFHRGTAYLTLASQYIQGSVPEIQRPDSQDSKQPEPNDDKETLHKQNESRKLVKLYAKRALRDYTMFLSRLEYSCRVPVRLARDFNDRVNLAANGVRMPRASDAVSTIEPCTAYPITDLFSAKPPSDLPPYPAPGEAEMPPPNGFCEGVTYHPLLTDTLHSLLLCHCILQTPTKELLRHTYMVARLVRLADGYPIFQANSSPARADWVDLLRRLPNWLHLAARWEELCEPAPLPFTYDTPSDSGSECGCSVAQPVCTHTKESPEPKIPNTGETPEPNIFEAKENPVFLTQKNLADEERVANAIALKTALAAQERMIAEGGTFPKPSSPDYNAALNRRWASDHCKDCLIVSQRASLIAEWIKEAPIVTGLTRRKKRTKKAGKPDVEGAG